MNLNEAANINIASRSALSVGDAEVDDLSGGADNDVLFSLASTDSEPASGDLGITTGISDEPDETAGLTDAVALAANSFESWTDYLSV